MPGVRGGTDAAEVGAGLVRAATETSRTGEPAGIGASAGLRLLDPGSAGRALSDADEALYAAKRRGGGRAVVWSAGPDPS